MASHFRTRDARCQPQRTGPRSKPNGPSGRARHHVPHLTSGSVLGALTCGLLRSKRNSHTHHAARPSKRLTADSGADFGRYSMQRTQHCSTSTDMKHRVHPCDRYPCQYLTQYLAPGCVAYRASYPTGHLLRRFATHAARHGRCTCSRTVAAISNRADCTGVAHIVWTIPGAVDEKVICAARRVAHRAITQRTYPGAWSNAAATVSATGQHHTARRTGSTTADQVGIDARNHMYHRMHFAADSETRRTARVEAWTHTSATATVAAWARTGRATPFPAPHTTVLTATTGLSSHVVARACPYIDGSMLSCA